MKKILIIIVVVAAIAIGAWAIFGRSDNKSNTSSGSSSSNSSSNASTNQPSTNPSATSTVSIENFAFTPSAITIKKGTMVTWTNNDNTTHTVTKDNADTGPDSSDLTPGSVYRFTYNQVGTFKYHCKFHSDMTGSVTVTD